MIRFGDPGGRVYKEEFEKWCKENNPPYFKYTAKCGHRVIISAPAGTKGSHDIDWVEGACPICDKGVITLNGQPLPEEWYNVNLG